MERDFITEQKNNEELEAARLKRRKTVLFKAAVAVLLVLSLGSLFGGMFSGINRLVITGIVLLIGGAVLLSLATLGSFYVKSAKENVKKYGGSLKPYVCKGASMLAAIAAAIAFGVLGFVLSEFYLIGAIVCFFVFILIFFGWQP